MMRFPVARRKRSILEITPLVDVVFLLLVFFLLTSTSMLRGMNVDLPGAASAEALGPRPVVVSVLPDGEVRVDGRAVRLTELEAVLREKLAGADEPALTIEADRRAAFERFARVLDAARLAGARRIDLATQLTPAQHRP